MTVMDLAIEQVELLADQVTFHFYKSDCVITI